MRHNMRGCDGRFTSGKGLWPKGGPGDMKLGDWTLRAPVENRFVKMHPVVSRWQKERDMNLAWVAVAIAVIGAVLLALV